MDMRPATNSPLRRSLLLVASAVLLAACSSSTTTLSPTSASTMASASAASSTSASAPVASPTSATASQSAGVGGSLDYSWWGSQPRTVKTQAVVGLYLAAHKNVTINGQFADFTSYFNRLTVQAAGHNLPCVVQMQSTSLGAFANPQVLLPLDDLVASGQIDVSGVDKKLLDTGKGPDGKLYMIPTGTFMHAVLLNTTELQKAGIASPASTWTWTDYTNLLLALQSHLPSGKYAAELNAGGLLDFMAFLSGNGATFTDPTGKTLASSKDLMIQWFTIWETLRKAGATVTSAMSAEETDTPETKFIALGTAMERIEATNQLSAIQAALDTKAPGDKLVMLPLPYGPSGPSQVPGTNGISIAANCNNVVTAASYINFFLNDIGAAKAYQSDNGTAAAAAQRQALESDPNTPAAVKVQLQFYDSVVAQGALNPQPYPAAFTGLSGIFKTAYQEVSSGQKTASDAVDEFFTNAQNLLK